MPGELIRLDYEANLRLEPKYFDNNELDTYVVTATVHDGTMCMVLAALSDTLTQRGQESRGCTWYLLLTSTGGIGWDFFINKHADDSLRIA